MLVVSRGLSHWRSLLSVFVTTEVALQSSERGQIFLLLDHSKWNNEACFNKCCSSRSLGHSCSSRSLAIVVVPGASATVVVPGASATVVVTRGIAGGAQILHVETVQIHMSSTLSSIKPSSVDPTILTYAHKAHAPAT